jgi:hypothetical protein|tara:strand:- start:1365 stop:1514 length:150 start_codon:yes stop_codon:yes gene_type:complete
MISLAREGRARARVARDDGRISSASRARASTLDDVASRARVDEWWVRGS